MEQEVEKIVSLISELIDEKVAESKADPGDSYAGMGVHRIRISLEEQFAKVLKRE